MSAPKILPLLLLAACTSTPTRAGLRFRVTDPADWTQDADGRWSCSLLGARCAVDLGADDARLELAVENPTAAPIEVSVGPEATKSPTAAIGELRVLPLGRVPVENVPDYEPYVARKPVALPDGARATFYLDTPLGREPTIGQYPRARDRGARRPRPLRAAHAVAGRDQRRRRGAAAALSRIRESTRRRPRCPHLPARPPLPGCWRSRWPPAARRPTKRAGPGIAPNPPPV
jgi:hypothetical protein